MKTDSPTPLDDELRPEYDETLLKDGVRGTYAQREAKGTDLARLDPDVAAAFPDDGAVAGNAGARRTRRMALLPDSRSLPIRGVGRDTMPV